MEEQLKRIADSLERLEQIILFDYILNKERKRDTLAERELDNDIENLKCFIK